MAVDGTQRMRRQRKQERKQQRKQQPPVRRSSADLHRSTQYGRTEKTTKSSTIQIYPAQKNIMATDCTQYGTRIIQCTVA